VKEPLVDVFEVFIKMKLLFIFMDSLADVARIKENHSKES
jgi:hypothetical protein